MAGGKETWFMSEWQDISSAPKSCSALMLWCSNLSWDYKLN